MTVVRERAPRAAQVRRIDGHANHLLNGFLDLKAKYALLDPMLVDQKLKDSVKNERAQGFLLLRHTLFLSCAQDIAKLGFDNDARTPSVGKIVATLEEEQLRSELRDIFAQRAPTQWGGDEDPEIRSALAAWDAADEAQRKVEYDTMYENLRARWRAFSESDTCEALCTLRNKVSAHTELLLIDNRYQVLDIGELGIAWNGLRDTLLEMQEIVELIGLTVRSSNFAWNGYQEQIDKSAAAFWGTAAVE